MQREGARGVINNKNYVGMGGVMRDELIKKAPFAVGGGRRAVDFKQKYKFEGATGEGK